ncbi:class I SAM-dependent methyltransferase [Stygiolobus caldivivus]|uniref:Methyltransferase n=1 Tax=Stygiolobus caldivivus TaxID=2824673 RepID=A0A8D5U816_9CREN|nr:methyltransferase [Stygiolobus caldivivus]BCU70672.1 methyltransferase [Stygiolobus caldivivus]
MRRHKETIFVNDVVNGIPLSLESSYGLFSKNELDLGTKVLLENLILPEKGVVADVGCGYGPIGIYVALKNPNLKVYMLDIDERAVYYSIKNVKKYGLQDRVNVIRSDVFDNLPKDVKFDAIFSNPPLKAGKKFIQKLASSSYDKLADDGLIELVVYKGEENVINLFKEKFELAEVYKRVKGYSLIIIRKKLS